LPFLFFLYNIIINNIKVAYIPKTEQTPGSALQSFLDEYQVTAFFLSKEIDLSYQTVLNILKGKGKISVPTALRLGKYFGNSPQYWMDVQVSSEIKELSANKKMSSVLKKIPKAQKPKAGTGKKAKTTKSNALSAKRKKAAKVPGAKQARGRKRTRKSK
jgi:addiction module HigA family antidote